MRRLLILSVVLVLGGCQLALPGKAGKPAEVASENPITGDEISVTSLDAQKQGAGADQAKAALAQDAPIKPDSAAAKPGADAVKPEAEGAKPDASPVPEIKPAPAAEVVVKTPGHLACEKKGGRWSMAGSAKASFCQTPTKDAGKSCRKEGDCAGYCLAKSRTCAPYTPLFGCNDILNSGGRAITQCIN